MMTEDDLAVRLHGLVAHPPNGRNLMPGIHKAAARRRTRVAAVSTGLGVTGVVVAGAVAAASLKKTPAAQSIQAAATPPVSPSAEPSVGPSVAASAAPSDTAVGHQITASLGDTAAELRAAPYYYQRSLVEQNGQRTYRLAWIGRTSNGRLENSVADGTKVVSMDLGTAEFASESDQVLTWDDFSSSPSSQQVHTWLYGTDTAGPAADSVAFGDVRYLLSETPTSTAFRLAALKEIEQIPGVTVTASVTDAIGRTGERVVRGPRQYVIDPADGRLLQEDDTFASCDGGPAGVALRTVLLEAGAVGSDVDVLPPLPRSATTPTGAPVDCPLGYGAPGSPAPTSTPAP